MKKYISKMRRSRMPITTYQVVEPSHTRCCLCKCRLSAENVSEIRPTGYNGKRQEWTFCDICYLEYNELCNKGMNDRILLEFFQRLGLGPHSELKIPQIRIR